MNYKILGIVLVIILVAVGVYAYTRHAQAPVVSTATTTPESMNDSTGAATTGTGGTKTGTGGTVTQKTPADKDALIKSELASVIVNAAAYKNAHTMSYGTDLHTSCASAVSGTTVFSYPSVRAALVTIVSTGSKQQVCKVYDGGSSFAVSVETLSNPSQWYCVDSTGFKGNTSGNTLATSNAGCR